MTLLRTKTNPINLLMVIGVEPKVGAWALTSMPLRTQIHSTRRRAGIFQSPVY